ncbi:unnamed protein product [Clonostachys rosea]|uniref:Uncharacterized protein n=1 Tax=Bionectria ochroleuca TaxID=29856 RepID=A0ABY6V0M8_BIOOC|nr:unnamed protein product [Clonostachys rosea]
MTGRDRLLQVPVDQQTLVTEQSGCQEHGLDQDCTHDAEHDDPKTARISIRKAPGLIDAPRLGGSDGGKARRESRPRSAFFNWIIELVMLFIADGLLVAICIILDRQNDNEMTTLKGTGIILNTLIAILATIFRAILAFNAFELIAQLKWDWISDRFSPMQELQLFEDASRGVYGSLCLLPRVALHQPLAIGAIMVAALSLGIRHFMQQAIQPYQCLRATQSPGQVATIRGVNTVDHGLLDRLYTRSSLGMHLGVRLKIAIEDSLVNPSTDANVPALFTCTSGNCTFPTLASRAGQLDDQTSHASVGICSRGIDVYDFVQGPELIKRGRENATEFKLPVYNEFDERRQKYPPMSLILGGKITSQRQMDIRTVGNLTWARSKASAEFFNRARWSISNFTILAASRDRCDRLPDGNYTCPTCKNGASEEVCRRSTARFKGDISPLQVDYVAASCILYPCIKYYSAKVDHGVLLENTIREVPLRPQRNLARPAWSANVTKEVVEWRGVKEPCYVNKTVYTSSNISTTSVQFHTDNWASESPDGQADYQNVTAPLECVFGLSSRLVGSIRSELPDILNANCTRPRSGNQLECETSGSRISSPVEGFLRNSATSIETIRENVESMAMRITTEMRKVGRGGYVGASPMVEGEVLETKSCLRVVWGWLALPLVIFRLCAILLVWTIVQDMLQQDSTTWKSLVLPLVLKDVPGIERMGPREVQQVARGFELKIEKLKQG